MQTRAPAAIAILLLTALAGCAAEEKVVAPTTTAPPAAPTVETGTISGVLVNEEDLPVPNVEIVLQESKNATKSDATGKFTFNGLQPGSYTVLASALGFESLAR